MTHQPAGSAARPVPAAIHKHLAILENARLIRRRKTGRTTYLTIDRQSLRSLQGWLAGFHPYWGTDAESLANYEESS
jgi:DNA-binding transcriptional ArsR family regulator